MSDSGGLMKLRPLPGMNPHTKVYPHRGASDIRSGIQMGSSLSRFSMKRLPQVLLKHSHLLQGMCSFLCSTEADFAYLDRFVKLSLVVNWDEEGKLVIAREDAEFVFGGNTHDDRVGSLKVQELLCDLKIRHPDKVRLLIGDRDVIKARMATLLVEVSKGHLQESSLRTICGENAHWFTKGTVGAGGKSEGGKDVFDDQVGWMVDVVLGKEKAFGDRRAELEARTARTVAVAEVVADMRERLEAACQTAMLYVGNAELAYLFDKVLFVHGGVSDSSCHFVPDFKDRTPPVVSEWVQEVNLWLQRTLSNDAATELASSMVGTPLVGTPFHGTHEFIASEAVQDSPRVTPVAPVGIEALEAYCRPSETSVVAPLGPDAAGGRAEGAPPLGSAVLGWLNVGSICSVVTGHEYVGEVPLVSKASSVMQLRCNTAGGCEVLVWRDGSAMVHGRMIGGDDVEYIVTPPNAPHKRGSEILGDEFVGHHLPGVSRDLVRAKLSRAHLGLGPVYLIGDSRDVRAMYSATDLNQITGWPPHSARYAASESGHSMAVPPESVRSANPAHISNVSMSSGRKQLADRVLLDSSLLSGAGSGGGQKGASVSYAQSHDGAALSEASIADGDKKRPSMVRTDSGAEDNSDGGEQHEPSRHGPSVPREPSQIAKEYLRKYKCPVYTPTPLRWLQDMPEERRDKTLNDLDTSNDKKLVREWEQFVKESQSYKHVKARQPQPRLPQRFPVPDDCVSWDVKYFNYEPVECPSELLPPDKQHKERPKGAKKNPYGRTGLTGRGIFWEWGENLAIDPCITRTETTSSKRTQVLVCRAVTQGTLDDYHELSLPGGMRTTDSKYVKLPEKRDLLNFMRQLMMENMKREGTNVNTFTELDRIFIDGGTKVLPNDSKLGSFSQGYCDDVRNTDDAWVSTEVWHFHMPDRFSNLLDIPSHLSDWKGFKYQWLVVDSGLPEFQNLYASHKFFVDLCVPTCQCGRRKYTQDDGSHPSIDEADDAEDNSGPEGADAHTHAPPRWSNQTGGQIKGGDTGTLQFVGKSSVAKYVRCEVKDKKDAHYVWKCLEAWGMQQPHVVLSLTGAATAFNLKDKDRLKIFESGILRAAQSMKAVVVTGGTDAGVMKYMGQAAEAGGRDGHLVPMLGIAPWGALIGREALLSKEGAEEEEDNDSRVHVYSKNQPNSSFGAGIDTNHQYFVLVDDGTASQFGTEIYARAQMEYILSNPNEHMQFDRQHHEFLEDVSDKRDSSAKPHRAKGMTRTLPTCPRCEGVTEDTISNRHPKNSISKEEKDEWDEVKRWLTLGKPGKAADGGNGVKYVECRSCKATLLREDVIAEEMMLCCILTDERKKEKNKALRKLLRRKRSSASKAPSQKPPCNHYFFKSRVKAMRETGRRTIQCDSCNAHAPVLAMLKTLIPSVLVVVEGGPGTIKTVVQNNEANARAEHADASSLVSHQAAGRQASAPKDDRNDEQDDDFHLPQSSSTTVPIVVVEGSGRAADFIAFVWCHLHKGKYECGHIAHPRGSARDLEGDTVTHEEQEYNEANPHTHRKSLCVAQVRRYKDAERDSSRTPLLRISECPRIEAEYRRIFKKNDAKLGVIDKKLISQIVEVCRRKDATELFNLEQSRSSLDYHIMKAVCCGTVRDGAPLSTVERLQLAIDWDRQGMGSVVVDMAQQELLDDGSLGQGDGSQYNRKKMVYALTYALCNNSPRFAELLDNAGVRIPANQSIIKELYPKGQAPPSKDTVTMNSMFWILNDKRIRRETQRRVWQALKNGKLFKDSEKELKLHWVRQLLSVRGEEEDPEAIKKLFDEKGAMLTGVTEKNVVWNKYKFKSELLGTFIHMQVVMQVLTGWQCLRGQLVVEALEEFERKKQAALKGSEGLGNPYFLSNKLKTILANNREASIYLELFLWAILMGRTDIAILYWRICNPSSQTHCITRALFACALSRRVAQHPLVDEQARKQLIGDERDESTLNDNFSSRFEQIALDCLDLTFRMDQKAAVDALMVKWITPNCWFDATQDKPEFLTPLTLAGIAKADKFVDHAAFQMALDRLWHGYLIRDIHEATQDQQRLLLPFSGWHAKNFLQNTYLAIASIFPPLCIMLEFWKLPSVDDIDDMQRPDTTPKQGTHIHSKTSAHAGSAVSDVAARMDPRSESFSVSWLVARQIKKLVAFYNAPVVSFYFAATLYFLFCVLFTLVGLFMGKEPTTWEIFLWVWTFTSLISVIRQAGTMGPKPFLDFGNTWELAMYLVYIVAFAARVYEISLPAEEYGFGFYNPASGEYNNLAAATRESALPAYATVVYKYAGEDLFRARGLHGVIGIFFWLRFLDMCRVNATLGPLIVVMIRMLTDIGYFLIITAVFMVSFGSAFICAFQPISDPPYTCNGGALHKYTFHSYEECIRQGCSGECSMLLYKYVSDVVFFTFKPMLGEQFVDEPVFSAEEEIDGVVYDSNRRLGGVLLLVYLIISAIMLLNLLIAIMNNTYTGIQNQSRQVWRYQRMEIVLHYAGKKGFPPPISIIIDLYTFFKYVYDLIRQKRVKTRLIPRPRGQAHQDKFHENLVKLWEQHSQKKAAFQFDDTKGGWLSRVMSMEYVDWGIVFNIKKENTDELSRKVLKNSEKLALAAIRRRERAVEEARMVMVKRLKHEALLQTKDVHLRRLD